MTVGFISSGDIAFSCVQVEYHTGMQLKWAELYSQGCTCYWMKTGTNACGVGGITSWAPEQKRLLVSRGVTLGPP